jgi:hypothetical protein
MKKLFVTLCLFSFSIETFSEEYVCSFSWNGQPHISSYTRDGDHFIYHNTTSSRKEKSYIINETENMLFLRDETTSPDSIFISIIDKKNKKFSHNLLVLGSKESEGQEGKCLIRD